MSETLYITGEDGLSVLSESDQVLRRDAGMGLSEAWKLHEGGVRLYTGGGLVLGHLSLIHIFTSNGTNQLALPPPKSSSLLASK